MAQLINMKLHYICRIGHARAERFCERLPLVDVSTLEAEKSIVCRKGITNNAQLYQGEKFYREKTRFATPTYAIKSASIGGYVFFVFKLFIVQ